MEQIKKYMNPKWWLIVTGITFIVLFPILLFVGNSNNYVVPVEQFALLFVVLLGLVASGYLHREGGEGVSE
jgi:hypothetical protein